MLVKGATGVQFTNNFPPQFIFRVSLITLSSFHWLTRWSPTHLVLDETTAMVCKTCCNLIDINVIIMQINFNLRWKFISATGCWLWIRSVRQSFDFLFVVTQTIMWSNSNLEGEIGCVVTHMEWWNDMKSCSDHTEALLGGMPTCQYTDAVSWQRMSWSVMLMEIDWILTSWRPYNRVSIRSLTPWPWEIWL